MDFFELLQLSIGIIEKVPATEDTNWEEIFAVAKKQSLTGVMYSGIKKLPQEQRPPKKILLNWYLVTEKIKKRNLHLNEMAVRIVEQYTAEGFQVCILKGQGNALMYPDPMKRNSGDIDIWMKPTEDDVSMKTIRSIVNKYVMEHYKKYKIRFYHIEYLVDKIHVEAHYVPGIMNNPLYNARLQRYYRIHQKEQYDNWKKLPYDTGQIPVPTYEFNVIFQLSHMMHHYFDEGIGLRQMMDYYFVLKKQNEGRCKKEDLQRTLNYLGLWKFAGAVMYVMQCVFLLEQEFLIAPVDEKRGQSLMRVILKGGNFGKYSRLTKHGAGSKYLLKNWRSIRLVKEYPAEALSEPLFRTWHFFWRFFNS